MFTANTVQTLLKISNNIRPGYVKQDEKVFMVVLRQLKAFGPS